MSKKPPAGLRKAFEAVEGGLTINLRGTMVIIKINDTDAVKIVYASDGRIKINAPKQYKIERVKIDA